VDIRITYKSDEISLHRLLDQVKARRLYLEVLVANDILEDYQQQLSEGNRIQL
jgi:hypothetical protein